MIFVPSTTQDISRYYRNTFVKFKEHGDLLFFIKNVKSDCVTGVTENQDDFELWLSEEVPYTVDYILPNKSYFQWQRRACFLQRVPAKQYLRGVCEQNTSIRGMDNNGILKEMTIGFEILSAFVNKQSFPSMDEVWMNKDKNISTVLSPRFAFCHKTKHIYCDSKGVAELRAGGKFRLYYEVFRPEVTELLKNTSFTVM